MSFSAELPERPVDEIWKNRIAAIRHAMIADAEAADRSIDSQIIMMCSLFVASAGSLEFAHLPLFARENGKEAS